MATRKIISELVFNSKQWIPRPDYAAQIFSALSISFDNIIRINKEITLVL